MRKSLIARLYESTGRGLLDAELVDEVGYTLLLRCESMLDVRLKYQGKVRCVDCKILIEDARADKTMITCTACGWTCSWAAYQKTIKYKKLHAGGMTPFLEEYARKFPVAKTSGEKIILIDTLIHRFHWETSTNPGSRPGAVGLIEGKLKDVMPFLEKLTYGDHVPAEVQATRLAWRKKWDDNGWKKGMGKREREQQGV
ncbi:MAG: hypothetical protein GKR89_16155 [Candidatus Latescibacteria bacterium]|nr:hypothetical protein [Candidatus Latescibacterota bacterium]